MFSTDHLNHILSSNVSNIIVHNYKAFYLFHLCCRAGGGKLTKLALRKFAEKLRDNHSFARAAVDTLESYTKGRISAVKIIEVVDEVADRLNSVQAAACDYFSDAGVSVGLDRSTSWFICQVVYDLLV